MKIIDTHCHLAMDTFREDRDSLIKNFFSENGELLLSVSTNREDFSINKTLTEKYDNIYTCLGWHPHDASEFGASEEAFLINTIEKKWIIAVGEIGLDYYYNHSTREEQLRAFERQMALAKKYSLPVIIHSRDAEDDTIQVLRKFKGVKGIVHCFTSTEKLLNEALKLDYFISFSGVITFPKSIDLQVLVKKTPVDRILFETDSPYLTPVPYRGKRNDPLKVKHVIKKGAELLGMSPSALSEIVIANFKRLFSLNS